MTNNQAQICCNCRWWDTGDEFDRDQNGLRRYGPFEGIADVGLCRLTVTHGEMEHKNTKAAADDGSGYFAQLLTKSDFGCNQWAPRNEVAEQQESGGGDDAH